MLELLRELVFDYTLRNVALGAAVLGTVSGALGSFAVLRKQSLLGDAMSHAALPGVCLAFLVLGEKHPLVLLVGAAATGWLAAVSVSWVVDNTRVKYDSSLAMALSVFFGIGLVLLTFIQRTGSGAQAGLDSFLFGQAAALVSEDVITMAVVGGIALLLLVVFWKEFKLLSFDPEFGAASGFPMRALDLLLTTLLVIAIVIGLQTVGVVLMSALVVAPGVAARQWTDRLAVMIGLASLFGILAGVSGAVLSASVPNLPTGPTIVVALSALVAVSLLFAPHRGVVWGWLEARRRRRDIRSDVVLTNLYRLGVRHGDPAHPHGADAIAAISSEDFALEKSLRRLDDRGLVQRSNGKWRLTESGIGRAREVAAEIEGENG